VGSSSRPIFGSIVALPLFHYALRSLPSGRRRRAVRDDAALHAASRSAMGERHGLRAVLGALVGFAGVAAVMLAVT
jgi:hypothetical protein